MELREILLRLKTENGLTTDLLSKQSGVPKGTLNKLFNGETRNPTGETLKKIADALNCPVEALVSRSPEEIARLREDAAPAQYGGRIRNSADMMVIRRHPIPLLGDIAAGEPIYADEQAEMLYCDDAMRCDFALRVRGDSMIGARINDGDIVFIRSQDDVEDGEIAAVILDEEATLKRVYHIKHGLQLLSENPKYPPMIFTAKDCNSIRILGKAVGFQGSL